MRKVNIRALRSNLSEHLKNMPFAITRHGKVIAMVDSTMSAEPISASSTGETPKKEFIQTCKHGYPVKLCQKCRK